MKTITQRQIIDILNSIDKPTFVHIVSQTKVRMNKGGNPFYGEVIKRKSANYLVGCSYEKRVNNNRVKEDKDQDFVAQSCTVGKHISKCVLWNNNTKKYYLMVEIMNQSADTPKTTYIFRNNEIELGQIKMFLPTPSNYQSQDLDNTVKVITIALDNILQITINKQSYMIVDEVKQLKIPVIA